MKVIDKQFMKEILLSTGFVLMALVALFAFKKRQARGLVPQGGSWRTDETG